VRTGTMPQYMLQPRDGLRIAQLLFSETWFGTRIHCFLLNVGVIADQHHRNLGDRRLRLKGMNHVQSWAAVAVEKPVDQNEVDAAIPHGVQRSIEVVCRRDFNLEMRLEKPGDGLMVEQALPDIEHALGHRYAFSWWQHIFGAWRTPAGTWHW